MVRPLFASIALLIALGPVAGQNPREKKVRDDRVKVEADGFWIYNDYAKAVAEAKKTGRPLVVLAHRRCARRHRPGRVLVLRTRLGSLVEAVRAKGIEVATGRFRAHMDVSLVNDGPVTILLDSKKVF